MIILLVILAIIAIAGFAVTTAPRKGLDPKDEYDYGGGHGSAGTRQ